MGLFSSIFRRRRASRPEVRREAASGATSVRSGAWPLLAVTPPAMQVATVYRCVTLLSEKIASLGVRVCRKSGGLFVEDTSDPLSYLLNVQPDSYMSAFDFWKQVVQDVLLRGNAYIVPVFGGAGPVRLALPRPVCVSHDAVNDLYTVNDINAGISGVFTEGQIIHFKNHTFDGKTGVSTIAFARMTLDIVGTGDAETLNRFANGGNIRGLVGNDSAVRGFGEYADEQLEKTATDIDSKFSGGQKIVSLPGQVQFTPLSLSSTDMQFLETRKFSVREICRFFGVHPSFVFDDTSNNYKSAESANVAFLTDTINPILVKFEREMERKLFAPSLAFKRRVEFNREALLVGDPSSMADYQSKVLSAGLATVNELRLKMNRPAVDGGDQVLVSANLKNINDLGDGASNTDGNGNE